MIAAVLPGKRGAKRCGQHGAKRGGQRGAALLAVVVLLVAAGAVSAAVVWRVAGVAAEVRARRDVLCARYAAVGGLVFGAKGPGIAAPSVVAAAVGSRAGSVAVSLRRPAPSWCVLRSSATCGSATRTLEHTLADPAACGG